MRNARLISRNFLASLITQIISWALTFAVTLFLPRYAGATGFGDMAVAGAFVALLGVLVPLGTSSVLVKEIARDHSRAGELLSGALIIRIPLAILFSAVAYISAHLLNYSLSLRMLILVGVLGMIISTVNEALGAVMQGMENLTRQGVGILTDKFLLGALTFLLIYLKQPLWAIAGIAVLTASVSCAVNLYYLRSYLPVLLRWRGLSTSKYLVKSGIPFIGLTLFTTLYGQSDPLILKFLTNDHTVGWYAVALRFVGTTMFLPVAINSALIPSLSRLYVTDKAQFITSARRMLTIAAMCGVPVALFLVFGAHIIFDILHYPPEFLGGIPVLRVGGAAALLYYLTVITGAIIIASDLQGKMLGIFTKACLIGVPGCFLFAYLGDRYFQNGAVGAMLSDTLMETYVFVCLCRVLGEIYSLRSMIWLLGRLILAALPMGLLLFWFTSSHSPVLPLIGLWTLLPGIAIYVSGCFLLRCVDRQETMTILNVMVLRRAQSM